MFIVSNSTSKAATDCRGRGSSQCLLLVNPHQKQVQTGGRGSSQCLLLVNPRQKQLQTVGGGGAPSVYC